VTLVDTSAWVEYLRATGSTTHRAVRRLLDRDEPAYTTDVVVMEVLAGARDDDHRDRLRRLLARCEHVPVEGLDDFEAAAELYRTCRRGGETARALTDCLIAVVALRASLLVLHADRDFEVLERHTGLRADRGGRSRR
jgi:predicted nucleic acid-binding protein